MSGSSGSGRAMRPSRARGHRRTPDPAGGGSSCWAVLSEQRAQAGGLVRPTPTQGGWGVLVRGLEVTLGGVVVGGVTDIHQACKWGSL